MLVLHLPQYRRPWPLQDYILLPVLVLTMLSLFSQYPVGRAAPDNNAMILLSILEVRDMNEEPSPRPTLKELASMVTDKRNITLHDLGLAVEGTS